jgi:probable HAF family extracellular repeat protein
MSPLRFLAGLLTLGAFGAVVSSAKYIGYHRAETVWGYEAHDLGTASGASYRVLYLGALGGHHTAYHGGAIQGHWAGTSINIPSMSVGYSPQPCLIDYGGGAVKVAVLGGRGALDGGIVYGLNRKGWATGTVGSRALLYRGREVIGLQPAPGFNQSEGRSVNDYGAVAGFSETAGPKSYLHEHATVWDAAGPHDLGVPKGCVSSRANAINDRGQVVVSAIKSHIRTTSFLYDRGRFIDLGTLGGVACVAEAINNSGQVVGTSEVKPGVFHAFLWTRGRMVDLGVLAADNTYSKATGINDAGEVAGWSGVGEGWSSVTRPFVWTRGLGLQDLTKLAGWACPFQPRTAYGISQGGDILVYGYRKRFWNAVQGLAILERR